MGDRRRLSLSRHRSRRPCLPPSSLATTAQTLTPIPIPTQSTRLRWPVPPRRRRIAGLHSPACSSRRRRKGRGYFDCSLTRFFQSSAVYPSRSGSGRRLELFTAIFSIEWWCCLRLSVAEQISSRGISRFLVFFLVIFYLCVYSVGSLGPVDFYCFFIRYEHDRR
ncbi:hypothetical protein OPV22_015660 [Ensete ventricosum]|uniref:Uncharacterized protein n=1 Tax=Ensete ventricosum TaxID=4639 RepID=A0AAV8PTF1_ENSVE|nr:hypothetical protein OPV22_015660 [Ensete ventricosum]